MLPGVDENLADHVLGQRAVAHDAEREAIDAQLVPREQGSHGELVASGDLLDEALVGRGLCDHGGFSHPPRTGTTVLMSFSMRAP